MGTLMAASRDAEGSVYRAAKVVLRRWLERARAAVMAPYDSFRSTPNAAGVDSTKPFWQTEVERIIAALTPALQEGWAGAHLPGNYNPNDPFIQANLTLTRNLLVRIPDEIHALIVAKILDGTNSGKTIDQVATTVDDVLTYTGSENWDARARTIAQTETTRHFSSSMLAHGLLAERQDGTPMEKTWETLTDGKERSSHRDADKQTRPLSQPFLVGGFPMMFPGDPNAPADEVCGCRCYLSIKKVGS